MSDIVLSNLTDLIGQLFHFVLNCLLYELSTFAYWILQVFNVPYSVLVSVYNILVSLITVLPDVITTCFSWMFNAYPSFLVLIAILTGLLTIQLLLGFVQLLLRVIPFV